MSQSAEFCPAANTCLPQTAELAWGVTRRVRISLHEIYRVNFCASPAPFGPADPAARRPRQACENVGCVDLFMDVWTHAHMAMHARFSDMAGVVPSAALAYFTTCARSRMAELNRQERVTRGGVAKPQRRDGLVGRIATGYGDPWLSDVFRFLLGYAASAGRQQDGWPLDVLTRRKNSWDAGNRIVGSAAARDELRADVANCLAVIRREAGGGWLYECILLPLANRGGQAGLPEDMTDQLRCGTTDNQDSTLDSVAPAILADLLRLTWAGASPGAALRAAVEAWLGDEPCPEAWARTRADDLAVRRLAKRLLADLAWNVEAA
jgi:hypothetical protein